MSFILDAIARSEAERKQRDMPGADVLAFPGNTPPPKRKSWPYLIAIAALLLNGVLLYLLFSGDQSITQTDSLADIKLQPPPAKIVTTEKPAPSNNPAESIGDLAAVSAPVTAGTPDVPSPKDSEVATARVEIALTATLPKTTSNNLPAVTPTTSEAVDPIATDEASWLRVEPDSLSREIDAAEQAASGRQAAPATALFNRVVLPSELPDHIRDQLPSVSFSGHLYSSNPKSSLVFVGKGRPVVTGQAIERDLILHEITPGGVVVKFRGYLIQVGVLQNWTLK